MASDRDEPAARHDAYAALRYPDYRAFVFARIVASMGSMMESVAIGWQIYERTHSALALGLIGLVDAVPSLGLALFGGHVADRQDRRDILIVTRVVLTLCSLGLLVVTLGEIALPYSIYALLFVAGIANGFQGPAGAALMPQLVAPEDFPNAVTWRTTLFQASSLIGPTLGGTILAWHRNPAHVYAVDATLGFISLVLLFFVKQRSKPATPSTESIWESLTGGIRFVWAKQIILAVITLDLFAVLFGGAVALLPIFAKDILHAGPQGLGILRAAPSAGALAMALLLVHRPPIRRTGRTMFMAVAAFGVAMIGFGISKNLALSLGFLALSGAVDNVSMVIRGTIVQAMTPNAMRGRVSAVNGVFIGTSNEIGGFESGVTAQWMGVVPSVIFGGIMTLVVVAVTAWHWPEFRDLGPLDSLFHQSGD